MAEDVPRIGIPSIGSRTDAASSAAVRKSIDEDMDNKVTVDRVRSMFEGQIETKSTGVRSFLHSLETCWQSLVKFSVASLMTSQFAVLEFAWPDRCTARIDSFSEEERILTGEKNKKKKKKRDVESWVSEET
jgi:hypothetical protein